MKDKKMAKEKAAYEPVWMEGPNGEKKQALTAEVNALLQSQGWNEVK